MKVVAKETGFYKGQRIREGQVFEIPDSAKIGKWMQPVVAPKAQAKPEAPVLPAAKPASKAKGGSDLA